MTFFKNFGRIAIIMAAMNFLPTPSSAAIMTFDDRSAFEAAVAGASLIEDAFENPIPGAEQVTFDSGVVSTNLPVSVFPDDNSVVPFNGVDGIYRNSVNNSTNQLADLITWDFPMPVIGFGFELSAASPDGVEVTFNGGSGIESFLFYDLNSDVTSGGFVGFVADTAFETIFFSNDNPISTDSFNIDDLVFALAASDPTAVPLPTTLPLTLFGIAGLLFFTRPPRRNT